MQDVLLIAAVAATFVFGWFLMGKLDRFLESNHRSQKGFLPENDKQDKYPCGIIKKSRRTSNGNTKTRSGSAPKSDPE